MNDVISNDVNIMVLLSCKTYKKILELMRCIPISKDFDLSIKVDFDEVLYKILTNGEFKKEG